MAERQAFSLPQLVIDTRSLDGPTRRAVEDLQREVQKALRLIAEQVDKSAGVRGEPTFYAPVNVNRQRLKGLAHPAAFDDAQIYGWSLSHDGHDIYDTHGRTITGLPQAVDARQAVPLDQLQTQVTDLQALYAPLNADYIVGTVNAALTAERVVTDTTSVDVDLATAGQAKWHVLPAGVDHNSLANLAVGDVHTQYQLEAGKDAANGYAGLDSVSRTTKGVNTTDYVVFNDATKGPVLLDGAGHYWGFTVTTLGVLVPTDLGTTPP